MSGTTTAVTTVVKMMESLPENDQARIAEHLREFIADLRDDKKWDKTFKKTQTQLAAAAQRAKRQIAKGQAGPLADLP